MPILQTPKDLGLAIRSRRKELGWDQAKLANQIGVTRQWVIDIEKGKPRAELELAMRALRVLGMSLTVDARKAAAPLSGTSGNDRQADVGTPDLDIDAIVERNRRRAPDYLREIETSNQLQLNKLAGLNAPSAASKALSRLEALANPKLPKTAVDYMREIEASNQLNKLVGPKPPGSRKP